MNIIKNIIRFNDIWSDEKLCLTEVERDGMRLRFVKNQTRQICLAAVEQNGLALQYVLNQTPEICAEAIEQYRKAYRYIRLPQSEPERTRFIKELSLLIN